MSQINLLGYETRVSEEHSVAVEVQQIADLDRQLLDRFRNRLSIEGDLTRQIVSFQANKERPRYRWFKYKEAFSVSLVDYLLRRFSIKNGVVLDPFAGMGTTLFAVGNHGIECHGIELLPIGQEIIESRLLLEKGLSSEELDLIDKWSRTKPWRHSKARATLSELRITKGAYPPETIAAIERVLAAAQSQGQRLQRVLRFALLCVLENVSYTRKDGQYLRWDYRSGRRQGNKPFDKGVVAGFDEAYSRKLVEIMDDIAYRGGCRELFESKMTEPHVRLMHGSCLEIMPTLGSGTYSAVITSPPYCNRYDYTRTYALELALLGIGEQELMALRQQMLTCTVENRAKDLMTNSAWQMAIRATDEQPLLQAILAYLDAQRIQGRLNNSGIPRMVRGYFYEMACVIAECARLLADSGSVIMVNDNVRYAGVPISVDLILSEIARACGLDTDAILVLPNGKGNSSQQMGEHGREPLRKCVYVWRKSHAH
ncbi:site-specific DNA-methyltransferase [bacterium]|nr:site-specific DNA-methyltransferase [bacterium]MBU1983016.1 site-specific DNA-methyltransferase [bacterium]